MGISKLKNFQQIFNSWNHIQEGQLEIALSHNNNCLKIWLRQDWYQFDIYLKENCHSFGQLASSKQKMYFFP